MLLLKAIVSHDENISPCGEAQTIFTEDLSRFGEGLPCTFFHDKHRTTWKSLSDPFKTLVADHHEETKIKFAASGIIEIRGEMKELLHDIV